MKSESRSGVSAGSTGWILLTLLVVSIFINYVDRSNLSIAAPIIQKEMHFSDSQMGLLLSAFFWTYSSLHSLESLAGSPIDFPLAGSLRQAL